MATRGDSKDFYRALSKEIFDGEKDACGVGVMYRPFKSAEVVQDALKALEQLEHRGAVAADGKSGDGAGVLTEIPRKLLKSEGIVIEENDALGVLFVPHGFSNRVSQKIKDLLAKIDFVLKSWRIVPVSPHALGDIAASSRPDVVHIVISSTEDLTGMDLDKALFDLRQFLTQQISREDGLEDFYIASLSCKSIVYKGMVNAKSLRSFYNDLSNPEFESRWAVFHRRFSTNTISRWSLAQPFRMIGHNGEINTIRGNINWFSARRLHREGPQTDINNNPAYEHCPIAPPDWAGSDSSMLDYAIETVLFEGDSIESGLMKLIPEAYEGKNLSHNPEINHFYEYYAGIQEPWDGPALVAFSDGISIGAVLDRNGLRPARYSIYDDGSIVLASEAGIAITTDANIVELGRLKPGEMIAVDIASGRIKKDREIKCQVANEHSYGQWLLSERHILPPQNYQNEILMPFEELTRLQLSHGYGKEDVDSVITKMALYSYEPVMSMGDDTALAALSHKPKLLFDYFKQRFAQVTNPPIDPIRERIVMSLESHMGKRSCSLKPTQEGANTLLLPTPIINECELYSIKEEVNDQITADLSLNFKDISLDEALEDLMEMACEKASEGATILILTDRGKLDDELTIPALLATSAVHHELINKGLRLSTSILVETAQCWTSHHCAALLGYGAQAICPYLAFATIRHWFLSDKVQKNIHNANNPHEASSDKLMREDGLKAYEMLTLEKVQDNFRSALESGLLKILSKMGISKLSSYIGAQIFECIGLHRDLVNIYFPGTATQISGLSIQEVEEELQALNKRVLDANVLLLKDEGTLKSRKGGEYHKNNNELVRSLHNALGLKLNAKSDQERKSEFSNYSSMLTDQPIASVRDLVVIRSNREPIPVKQVVPNEVILKKMLTGGMSLGALSKESHETLAIAMNRLGARSNSGEGGEDPIRNKPINVEPDGTSKDYPGLKNLKPGDVATSKVRQVASGRFGVTPHYLINAEQLEIKIAQGAKPGEGGQLPGHKVSDYIAGLRRTRPGVMLISPPPHHDIYSIEDLAQLIYDLKQVNKHAKVSVKLVAERGIGTVAAGVAKAGADIIHVSGYDGGTGAATVTSIKNAGMPWELGLAETHKALVEHGLRKSITLRVDGGLKSGIDVVKAAILGADEFAFGTIALLAQGCIMARVCHTNNCPVGIASQRKSLRERFHGDPESVVAFFNFIADEIRYLLAETGYKSLEEIRGKTWLLRQRQDLDILKTRSLQVDTLLVSPRIQPLSYTGSLRKYSRSLAQKINTEPDILAAVENNGTVIKRYPITNSDRTIGASLSGKLATRYDPGEFSGQIVLFFNGVAGQSFGAFNYPNVRMTLEGAANDYVGKGMHGGEVVIRDSQNKTEGQDDKLNVLAGNTCLYGATGGRLFISGLVGERFAVRNSAAQAVVEGAGDHCCEYMTGGVVVVLGQTGRNFGAGMTGGIAYVLDESGDFLSNLNPDGGKLVNKLSAADEEQLLTLIKDHFELTGSQRAQKILENWEHERELFIQIVPPSEVESVTLVDAESAEDATREEPLSAVSNTA